MGNEILTQENIAKALNVCYEKALSGLPVPGAKSCYELSEYYLNKYDNDLAKASDAFIKNQLKKCSSAGFILNVGGALEAIITIPANIGSVLYMQLRMIATIAVMAGYDVNNDELQTLVLECLLGTSAASVPKQTGITIAESQTKRLITSLPTKKITGPINKLFRKRIISKAGQTTPIKLMDMVPIVGGVVAGTFDYFETKVIAKRAVKMFMPLEDN